VRDNTVRTVLEGGGTAIGSMVFEFDARGISRLAAAAGAEFLIYDMEHTGWSLETIGRLVSAAGEDLVPMVRVPAAERHFVSPVFDMGALGVMVPMVSSADAARRVVEWAKYPTLGTRGVAFGMGHDDYRPLPAVEAMERANGRTLVILQIETREGLDNVEEIAAVDGVDVLWVGQSDLTASLGFPGDFADPRFEEALKKVAGACQAAGKAAGFMCTSPDEGRHMRELGYRALAYWGDGWLYQKALREGLEHIRG
jgi:2-dehydro-3-deoxyglucarate aldolase/4-hydroxy-2-oxoheptanedioate aldolase